MMWLSHESEDGAVVYHDLVDAWDGLWDEIATESVAWLDEPVVPGEAVEPLALAGAVRAASLDGHARAGPLGEVA